uniref:Uncharacterized protein n=1 Tax=Ditylenchus dipsaci TaxID=166011 RepID=A0A915ENW9_9BILA
MSDKKKAANLVKRTASKMSKFWAGGHQEEEDVGDFAKIYSVTKGKENRKKLEKIRLISYIDSPDYPEDLDLKLSGHKKVMEDIQSLSDREVSEQLNLLPKEEAKR